MKVLLLGADGFIGKKVKEALMGSYEVISATRDAGIKGSDVQINLLEPKTIAKALIDIKPDIIINCAGIVENSEKANMNVVFTTNLLEQALASGLKFKCIVISGSAAEYGMVDKSNIPVSEDAPLNATSGYGLSKLKESAVALDYRKKHKLPVVVARIFNPIGAGMHPRFLIPAIMQQVSDIGAGKKSAIEVSRLDSKRDYIDVADIADAIKALTEASPKHGVYNVGSGKSTSNKELIDFILANSQLSATPKIIEISDQPEPLIAIQADITRISSELGWQPRGTIEKTIKEIMHDARRR